MADKRANRPVGCDSGDVLIWGLLAEQFGQLPTPVRSNLWPHWRNMTSIAAGDLDGPSFQYIFGDPEMEFAPDAAFCTFVLARIPLPFAIDPEAGAVDQEG